MNTIDIINIRMIDMMDVYVNKPLEDKIVEVKKKLREMMGRGKETISLETHSVSEIFDTEYRVIIWDYLLDFYNNSTEKTCKKVLREIIKFDIKMFKEFLEKKKTEIHQVHSKKSWKLIESFKTASAYKSLLDSEEFQTNQDLNIRLYVENETLMNYFYLIEFYIAPKLKHKKRAPCRGHVTLSYLASSVMNKSFGMFVSTCGMLCDTLFNSKDLTRHLIQIGLVAYVGFSPSILLAGNATRLSALLLPLAGKFIRWSGMFNYLADIFATRDTLLYIRAVNDSLISTVSLIEDLRIVSGSLLDSYLSTHESSNNDDKFFEDIKELIDKFGSGYSTLENYLEGQKELEMIATEGEDGWVKVEKKRTIEFEEIKSSYICKK